MQYYCLADDNMIMMSEKLYISMARQDLVDLPLLPFVAKLVFLLYLSQIVIRIRICYVHIVVLIAYEKMLLWEILKLHGDLIVG